MNKNLKVIFVVICLVLIAWGFSQKGDIDSVKEISNKNQKIFLIGGLSLDEEYNKIPAVEKTDNETFAGIGVRFDKILANTRGGPFIIEEIFDGSPASKVNIKSGDHLIAINEQTLSNLTILEVVALLRGEIGTTVNILLLRNPSLLNEEEIQVEITRAQITAPTIISEAQSEVQNEYSFNTSKNLKNDVWSSVDMEHWKLISPNDLNKWVPDFFPNNLGMANTKVVTMGSKIFVFGKKLDLVELFNGEKSMGLWSSSDGANWSVVSKIVPWEKDNADNTINIGFSPFSLGNSLFVHVSKFTWEDQEREEYENSIWISSDGINWTKNLAPTLDNYIADLGQPVLFKNSLWMFKINKNSGKLVLLNSSDGIYWNKVAESSLTEVFSYFAPDYIIPFKDHLYVFGLDNINDNGEPRFFRSTDGRIWDEISNELPKASTESYQNLILAGYSLPQKMIVFNEKLWYINLFVSENSIEAKNDLDFKIWSTNNGIDWSPEPSSDLLSNRLWSLFVSN